MSTKFRRARDKQEMKELILNAAKDIVASEGFENLSIRKIARNIEFSPSVIYHYFENKDDVMNHLMKMGYKKIITAVTSAEIKRTTPEEKLKGMTKNYIEAALKMPEEFLAAQLNDSPEALKYTSSLFQGASKEKPALTALYHCLKEIYRDKEVDENSIEMTSQIIVTSTLGLIIKLIIERNIDDDQKQRLIEYFSNVIVIKIARES